MDEDNTPTLMDYVATGIVGLLVLIALGCMVLAATVQPR